MNSLLHVILWPHATEPIVFCLFDKLVSHAKQVLTYLGHDKNKGHGLSLWYTKEKLGKPKTYLNNTYDYDSLSSFILWSITVSNLLILSMWPIQIEIELGDLGGKVENTFN